MATDQAKDAGVHCVASQGFVEVRIVLEIRLN